MDRTLWETVEGVGLGGASGCTAECSGAKVRGYPPYFIAIKNILTSNIINFWPKKNYFHHKLPIKYSVKTFKLKSYFFIDPIELYI